MERRDITYRVSSLLAKVHAHYSDHGLQGLLWNGILFLGDRPIRRRSLSRTELQELASESGTIWYGDQEDPITITPPTHPELQDAFKLYPREYVPRRPFICELESCYLVGPNAVGVSKDSELILETVDVISFLHLGDPAHVLKRLLNLQTKPIIDAWDTRVFPLVSPDPSFYHWIMEYLPRLRLLDQYESQTGYEPNILLKPDPPKYVRDTLKLAGYGPDRYREWPGGEKRIHRLIVPSRKPHAFDFQNPSQSDYQPSRTDYHWLRDTIRSNVDQGTSTVEKNSKVYISRQKASSERGRRVVNYQELVAELRARGFEPYVLEDLSFQDQVGLFTEADVIMGPHGAGFANLIFGSDPLVIELFPRDVLRPHFYFLTNILGFEYEGIVTEPDSGDLVVDIEAVRDRLDDINV